MSTASVSVSTPSVESRKHARSKCAFKMTMTTFSPPTYSCSRHPSPDKSASRRRRANRAPSDRNRKKSTPRGNRDDSSSAARSNSTPVLATSVSNSPRALTAPIDCNNPAFTRPRVPPFERSSSSPTSASATRDPERSRRASWRHPICAQNASERVERRRVDTSANAARAASERTREAPTRIASMSTASTTAARAVRAWLEFMNKIRD